MSENPPDSELLGAYLRGGVEGAGAFEDLVRRHGGMVHANCRRAAESPEAAEDAAQTVFLVLARKAGSVRGEAGAWLHRVALNAALMTRKSEQARRKREKETADMLAKSRDSEAAEAALDWPRLASWLRLAPVRRR